MESQDNFQKYIWVLDKLPDIFRMGTFIDSVHMKL